MLTSTYSPWSHFLADFIRETLDIHLVVRSGEKKRDTSQISRLRNVKILVQTLSFLCVLLTVIYFPNLLSVKCNFIYY